MEIIVLVGKSKYSVSYYEVLSIRRKLAALSQITGKEKLQTINFALDVALAFEKTKLKMDVLHRAIEIAKGYLKSLEFLINFKRERLNEKNT